MNKRIVLAAIACLLVTAKAPAGTRIGNGGDPNEPKFKEIALNIQEWIQSGNADGIRLPQNITLEAYKRKMLGVLVNFNISFTLDKVEVDGSEKTCKNFTDDGRQNQILCNSQNFAEAYKNDINDIFRIIHHEFAGLAGLEPNQGSDSSYVISSQISDYLESTVVRRLPVNPRGSEWPSEPVIAACDFDSMKPLLEPALRKLFDSSMQHLGIGYDPRSFQIIHHAKQTVHHGVSDYDEFPMEISVRTERGNRIVMSPGTNGRLNLGSPHPIVYRDNEGYVIRTECTIGASVTLGYTPMVYFWNENLGVMLGYTLYFPTSLTKAIVK